MIRFFFKKKPALTKVQSAKFKETVKNIAAEIALKEEADIKSINLIFCSDEYIKKINTQFLGHDYETDIITFHDEDAEGNIESDILISVDTVEFNAKRFKVSITDELKRVVIHGILHLCGYDDKNSSDKKVMKRKENFYLKKIK